PERLGELLFEELRRDGRSEVGFPNGERTVFDVVRDDLAPEDSGDAALPDNAVLLATGGASGITAAILRHLVRPGMRVYVTGRSALPEEAAETAALGSAEQLRAHFIAAAKEAS